MTGKTEFSIDPKPDMAAAREDDDVHEVDDDAVAAFDEEAVDGADSHAARVSRLPRVLPTLFPGPPAWDVVFGRQAPLELELGFGRPHFLMERATEAPDHNIVGIEWKGRWSKVVWDKQKKGAYPNLRALHGNAWLLMGAMFEPEALDAMYLSFPDPWWKAKHKKRRIISDAFSTLLQSRLKTGGTLMVQTDVASLLEEILSRLEAQPRLKNLAGPGRLSYKPVGASTHREKRCRKDGIPIFRAVLQKLPAEA